MQAVVLSDDLAIKAQVAQCRSIEGLIVNFLEQNYALVAGHFLEEVAGGFQFALTSNTSASKPGVNVPPCFVHIPPECLRGVSFKPIPRQLGTYSDQPGFFADPEYFDARNKRIGLKEDPYSFLPLIRPSKIVELILSYAMVPFGAVRISRTIKHINAGPRDLVEMHCLYTPEAQEAMTEELLYVELNKLKALDQKRQQGEIS